MLFFIFSNKIRLIRVIRVLIAAYFDSAAYISFSQRPLLIAQRIFCYFTVYY